MQHQQDEMSYLMETYGVRARTANQLYAKRPPIIIQWTQQEEIRYIGKFFDRDVKSEDITIPTFLKQSLGAYAETIHLFMTDLLSDDELKYLARCVQNNLKLDSYAELQKVTADKGYTDPLTGKFVSFETQQPENAGQMPMPSGMYPGMPSNGFGVPYMPARGEDHDLDISTPLLFYPDLLPQVCKKIKTAVDYILKEHCDTDLIEEDLVYLKFPQIGELFNLDETGNELLKFLMVFRSTGIQMPRDIRNNKSRITQIVQFTGLSEETIKKFTKRVRSKTGAGALPFSVESLNLTGPIWKFLKTENINNLVMCYYQKFDCDKYALPLDFFPNTEDSYALIKAMIDAQKDIDRPRHILLYGLAGTGKTSFAATLCKQIGRSGYMITANGMDDVDEDTGNMNQAQPPISESRLLAISLCDSRVDKKESLIIVDEADDLINCYLSDPYSNGTHYDTRHKTMLNQIMDNTKTPVIWITNNTAGMIDPSCRRRFDYSIRFDAFTSEQRKHIWRNSIDRFNLQDMISEELIEKFSDQYPITPGGISNACMALVDIKPEVENVEKTVENVLTKHCELLGLDIGANKKFRPCKEYSLEGLNISGMEPEKLIDSARTYLAKLDKKEVDRPMTILLHGLPGTGKTELVKYIGSVLKKTVRVTSAQDFLDMFVGSTEQKIAEAFTSAEASGDILFIDEIDSLLHARSKAMHSWESSQVTTMLTCMERFRGIFIGATNHETMNDSASVRRFLFKIKFDYLTKDGVAAFMRKYFPQFDKYTDLDDYKAILDLQDLAPGDFGIVKMKSEFEATITLPWILDALKTEVDAKHENMESNNGSVHAGY